MLTDQMELCGLFNVVQAEKAFFQAELEACRVRLDDLLHASPSYLL